MYDPVFLTFVNGEITNNNKFYNMTVDPSGQTFTALWGRIGDVGKTTVYPISKWHSTIKSKERKGYKNISDLKAVPIVIQSESKNKDFNDFYLTFSKYTGSFVKRTFLVDNCSPLQIKEAQTLLNEVIKAKDLVQANNVLTEVFKVIPRRMSDVKAYLIKDLADKNKIVQREQDAIDSIDSSNVINTANPYESLQLEFEEIPITKEIQHLITSTLSRDNVKIHKLFKIKKEIIDKKYNSWIKNQSDLSEKLLIHGTRNANIFSILNSGLMIRPSNAASISGAAYGEGIYHSDHAQKSLGYTGYDNDKIFLLNKVHVGKMFTYEGWYRQGKGLDRSDMTYNGLKKHDCDSLYVKPGDGLLNSEYIIFNEAQHNFEYILWLK